MYSTSRTHLSHHIVNTTTALVTLVFLVLLAAQRSAAFRLSIVHTNDLHSHFTGTSPHTGGYARISSVIESIRARENAVLTLDAGDFSVGTLYHAVTVSSLFPHRSIELDWFDIMRYDVTTLGNHEHDATEQFLRGMLTVDPYSQFSSHRPAQQRVQGVSHDHKRAAYLTTSATTTTVLASNLRVTPTESCESLQFFANNSRLTQDLFVTKQYTDELSGETLTVGIMGLHGPASASLTMYFRRCIQYVGQDSWKEYVAFVKELAMTMRKKVDLVVALTHSGMPEDQHLLDAVNAQHRLIDVHISSHVHQEDFHVHKSGAIISQCFEYGRQVGVLQLDYNKQTKELNVLNGEVSPPTDMTLHEISHAPLLPHHIPITSSIEEHSEVKALIDSYSHLIDRYLLNQVHIHSDVTAPTGLNDVVGNVSLSQFHSSIPEFVAFLNDVFYNSSNQLLQQEDPTQRPLDFFMLPDTLVRVSDDMLSSSHVSLFTFGDCFRLVGTGTSSTDAQYGLPGQDLVFFYLNKHDALKFIEFLLHYSRLIDENFHPSMSSSITYEERFWGIPFWNRLHNVRINGVAFEDIPDSQLIHIGTFSVVLQYIMVMDQISWGIIQLSPHNIRTLSKKPYVLLSEYFKQNNLKIHAYTREDYPLTGAQNNVRGQVMERVKRTRQAVREEQVLMSMHRGKISSPQINAVKEANRTAFVPKPVAPVEALVLPVCNVTAASTAEPGYQCFEESLVVTTLEQLEMEYLVQHHCNAVFPQLEDASRKQGLVTVEQKRDAYEMCPAIRHALPSSENTSAVTQTTPQESFTPLLCWHECHSVQPVKNQTTEARVVESTPFSVNLKSVYLAIPAMMTVKQMN